MLIEHNYVLPADTDSAVLIELSDWCNNNLPGYGLLLHQEPAQPIAGLQGSIHYVVNQPPIKMSLRFTNYQDLNYFKLVFGDKFDNFIHSTTFQS